MTAETKIAQNRMTLLQLAERLRNVSEACRRREISRSQFYEYKRAFQKKGLDGLEKANPCFRERHVESQYPGYLLSQDTFMVGALKGVGRVYLQAVVDTYGSFAFAKLYTSKLPETAADILNDRVLPFYAE